MVVLAPQLTHGFAGARPGYPLPQHILEAITTVEEVDSFDGYPDKWLKASTARLARKSPHGTPNCGHEATNPREWFDRAHSIDNSTEPPHSPPTPTP